jgi:hypothetical protein
VVARRIRSLPTKNPRMMIKRITGATRNFRMRPRWSTSSSGGGGDEDFCSRRDQKLLLREILSIEPAVPRPLRWSEVPISFSRDDQWTSFSEPGKFPLVLDPVVVEVKLTKVLIDGGSGLNLIFVNTLKKMGLEFKEMLVPSKSPFYGIVPGNAAHPLGTVVLPVTFGTRENYRTEFIKFESGYF